jgi:hypothetical protein
MLPLLVLLVLLSSQLMLTCTTSAISNSTHVCIHTLPAIANSIDPCTRSVMQWSLLLLLLLLAGVHADAT